jgi:Fe-S oxidoreductase
MSGTTLDDLARSTELCAFCPKLCRSACPVSEAESRETTTPWGKMSLVHLARTQQQRLDTAAPQRILEACTGCGACAEKCAHGNPVAETLFAARAVADTPRARQHREAFESTGDVKARDHAAGLTAFAKDRSAQLAYFPGCTRVAHDGASVIARDLRALSLAFSEQVPVCDLRTRAQCCGYPLYADGQFDLVEENFVRLAEVLQGHQVVVTPDPGCAHMLSTVRSLMLGRRGEKSGQKPGHEPAFPAVVPMVELLAQHSDRFTDAARGRAVRYHDPCYLGRRGRSFDAPRQLLTAATGAPPLEFYSNRDAADCSGSGGLYPLSNAEGARAAARRRVELDGIAHGDDALVVTACPSARRGFERAGVRCVDLVDVLLGELP